MKHSQHFAAPLIIASALALPLSATADSKPWTLDPAHSRVGFEISHLVVSTVSGYFKDVTGTIALDEANLTHSNVAITVQAKSIDTGEPKRDEHLRSADFFDVAKYPLITFQSTKITRAGGTKYKLTGDLSLHGVSKPVTLDANVTEPIKTPWGTMARGVKASGKIKRSDYGLTWNKALETGGFVVGNDVTLNIQVEINH
jgi:polyisoprenoid-binding protein YceI